MEKSNVTTATIKSYGYDIAHDFRNDMRGGGTAIIHKLNLKLCKADVEVTHISTFGYVAGSLKCSSDFTIMIICIYRTGPVINQFFDDLNNLLAAMSLKSDYIIMAGDFNIHMEKPGAESEKLLEITESYGLTLLNDQDISTHIGGGCIDLIFYNSNLLDKTSIVVYPHRKLSDHFPITFSSFIYNVSAKTTKQISTRDLKNVDQLALSTDLQKYSVNSFRIKETFELTVQSFFKDINEIIDSHAPLISKTITVVPSAPWFDTDYKMQRAKRRKAERKWRKSKTLEDEEFFNQISLATSEMLLEKKKKYYRKMVDERAGDVRAVYSILNKELDRKSISPLPQCEDLRTLAADFNEFFVQKVKKIHANLGNHSPKGFSNSCNMGMSNSKDGYLNEFRPATLDEINEIISESGINCAPSDFLPSDVLKEHVDILCPVLCELVNLSLSTGSIDGLKIADIIPAIKGLGLDPNKFFNYRPISNLSFLGKLIERVVLRRLNEHMSNHGMHIPEQSAYKKHHSTETILVKIVNDLLIAFDSKSATVIIMLDLSAAFDTVSHKHLLQILHNEIKIGGIVYSWFESYLKGRAQRIRLGCVVSDDIEILFGVPQGSVLGPVLFNIYIRSIYGVLKNTGFRIQGYADDHQVYKNFKPCEQAMVLSMQIIDCFKLIHAWMINFSLQLNPGKTQIMVVAPPSVLKEITIHGVMLPGGICVRFKSTSKNLGIYMDERLNFNMHVINIKKDCFRLLRNICKRRFLFTHDQLKLLVNSLVVCKIDYCNALFYGISEHCLNELQRVQNAAAKAIVGLYKHDHMGDTIKNLHWLPIKSRINYKILLLVYKCLNGLSPDYLSSLLTYSGQGHSVYLLEPKVHTIHGDRAFGKCGPKMWNALPDHVKYASTLLDFKSQLKTHLFIDAHGLLQENELNRSLI